MFEAKFEVCGRCQEKHEAVEMRRFTYPPIVNGVTLTHWGLCPTTGQPILMDYGMTVSSPPPAE